LVNWETGVGNWNINKAVVVDISLSQERLWYRWQTPHEKFDSLAEAMRKRGMRRVLDLGCGAGRHLVFLARQGFEMYGTDIDPRGLARARSWLKQEGLSTYLAVADMGDLPYPDGFFDAVISMYVIHHNLVDGIRRTVAGVRRALRPGGWFFTTVNAWRDYKDGRGLEIEPGTWLVRESDCDVPVPHHLFREDELQAVWEGFRILELERKTHEWRDADSGQPYLSAHWEVWAERV
jgi:SAM-dependent methyltransferase